MLTIFFIVTSSLKTSYINMIVIIYADEYLLLND